MAHIYNETSDNIDFQNKTRGKNNEEIYFVLPGIEKQYHISIKGSATMDITIEESEAETDEG